jgi:hypothetical protein
VLQEITDAEKRKVLTDLINDKEITMLRDDMNNCFRPIWKNERDLQLDHLNDKEKQKSLEEYEDYTATLEDIETILECGILEWEQDGSNWYVKIWW